MYATYDQWADEIASSIQFALSGERKVSPKDPFNEAWMACTLHYLDLESTAPAHLKEVIAVADGINHSIPTSDEIAWAFLRLMRRGWLTVQNDSYGLTEKGRISIREIVGESRHVQDKMDRLKGWISINALSDD